MIKPLVFHDDKEVINLIQEARKEITEAYEFFNLMVEPEMIEYAIYKIGAAEKRFSYFLKWARENKINLYDPDNTNGINRRGFSLPPLDAYRALNLTNLFQTHPLPPSTTSETDM